MKEKEGNIRNINDKSNYIPYGKDAGKLDSMMVAISSDNNVMKHTSLSVPRSNGNYSPQFYKPSQRQYDAEYDPVKSTVTIPVFHNNSLLDGREFYLINEKCMSSFTELPMRSIIKEENVNISFGGNHEEFNKTLNYQLKKDGFIAYATADEKMQNNNNDGNDQGNNSNLLKGQSVREPIVKKEGKLCLQRQHIDYGKVDLSSKYYITTRRHCITKFFPKKKDKNQAPDGSRYQYTVNIDMCSIKPKFAQISSGFFKEKEPEFVPGEKVTLGSICNGKVIYNKKKIDRPDSSTVNSKSSNCDYERDIIDLPSKPLFKLSQFEIKNRNSQKKEVGKFINKEENKLEDAKYIIYSSSQTNFQFQKDPVRVRGSNPTLRSICNSTLTNFKRTNEAYLNDLNGRVTGYKNNTPELKARRKLNNDQKKKEDETPINQANLRKMSYSNKYIQNNEVIQIRRNSLKEISDKHSLMRSQDSSFNTRRGSKDRRNAGSLAYKKFTTIDDTYDNNTNLLTIEQIKKKHGLDQCVMHSSSDADRKKKEVYSHFNEDTALNILSSNVGNDNNKYSQSDDTICTAHYSVTKTTTGRADVKMMRQRRKSSGQESNLSNQEIYKNYINHLSRGKIKVKINLDEFDFCKQDSINQLNDILAKIRKSCEFNCGYSNSGFICSECSEFFKRQKDMQIDYENQAKLFYNLDEQKEILLFGNDKMKKCNINTSVRYQKSIPLKIQGNGGGRDNMIKRPNEI